VAAQDEACDRWEGVVVAADAGARDHRVCTAVRLHVLVVDSDGRGEEVWYRQAVSWGEVNDNM